MPHVTQMLCMAGASAEGISTVAGPLPDPSMRQPVPAAGVLHNLSVNMYFNNANGTATIQIMVNGVAVGLPVVYDPEETGEKKVMFEIPVLDGETPDVVSFMAVVAGDTGAITFNASSLFVESLPT